MIRQTTIRVIFPPLICRQTQKKDAAEVKSGKTKFDQIEWARLKKCGEDEIRTNWTDEVETIASEVEAEKNEDKIQSSWRDEAEKMRNSIKLNGRGRKTIASEKNVTMKLNRRDWKNAEKMKCIIRLSNNSFSIKLIFDFEK